MPKRTSHLSFRSIATSAALAIAAANCNATINTVPPQAGEGSIIGFDFIQDDDAKVTTTYEIEGDAFVPGIPTHLAITYTITTDWHMYWPGLNDSGPGPIIKFDLPEGWTIGKPLWPPPHRRYAQPGNILDHIYENAVTVLIPITAPIPSHQPTSDTQSHQHDETASHAIGLSLEWLVCEDVCIAESADHQIQIVLREKDKPAPTWTSAKQTRFDALLATIPKRIDHTSASSPLRAEWDRNNPDILNITVPNARSITFYPYDDGAWPISTLREGHADTDRLAIRFHPFGGPSAPPAPEGTDPSYIRALIRTDFAKGTNNKPTTTHVEIKVPRPGVVLKTTDKSQPSSP